MDKQKNYMLFSERKKLADEYEEWVNKPLEDGSKIKDCALSVITFMEIKGFCKITEGEVVLTREEYERLLKVEKDFNTVHYCFVEKSRVEEVRKETVEKFAERLGKVFNEYDEYGCWFERTFIIRKIYETKKEFTGGKNDEETKTT